MGIWKPAWLEALDTNKFFVSCSDHETVRKNEKNICCLDCCTSICQHCLPSHPFHRLVQVRRYVYHDVVRLEDLDKLIDCSNVQSYTINSSKVVFLKKRPQNRHFKGSGNICTSCDRCLQEPYIHCSLSCKVEYVLRQTKDLSPYLRSGESLKLSSEFLADADDTNHSSDLDHASVRRSTVRFVRKKRTSSGPYLCGRDATQSIDISATISRRKGVPQRSPLC